MRTTTLHCLSCPSERSDQASRATLVSQGKIIWMVLLMGLPCSTLSAQTKVEEPSTLVFETKVTPSESPGQLLARRIRSSAPVEDADFAGQLKIRPRRSPTKLVPLRFSVRLNEQTWTTIYESHVQESGLMERLTIVHSAHLPNQYLWTTKRADQPEWPNPTPLKTDQLSRPLGGSNFTILDLGMDFLYWPNQRLIKTEMRKGRWCRVLESRLPKGKAGPYSRVISWLDKETGGPLLAEAYDANNKLLKEFSIGSFKKVRGEWQLEDMKISNVQTRSRTWIEFDLD